MSHHLESFLEMMSAERGASPNTLLAYRADLVDALGFLGRGAAQAGPEELRGWLATQAGFSARTQARRLSSLRQFYQRLAKDDRLPIHKVYTANVGDFADRVETMIGDARNTIERARALIKTISDRKELVGPRVPVSWLERC